MILITLSHFFRLPMRRSAVFIYLTMGRDTFFSSISIFMFPHLKAQNVIVHYD